MKYFNPTSPHPDRAVQAWLILVGMAKRRQTATYEGLSLCMYGKEAPGVLDKILGHIVWFCIDNGLPRLTVIVVGKGRGTPGDDIPMGSLTLDEEREKVYEYDWYDIYPPTNLELQNAFNSH